MLVLFLLLIAVQAGTGLFATDDIFIEGPLTHLVMYETASFLTFIHQTNFNILLACIALHLLAIAYHSCVKKEPLVKGMITGTKQAYEGKPEAKSNYGLMAALITLSASAVWVLVISLSAI